MPTSDVVSIPESDLVFVRCELSRSGFSSERVFRLIAAGEKEFVGSAPVQYCRTKAEKLLKPDEPQEGKRIPGWVAARVIRKNGDGSRWLSFPDGSIAQVPEGLISEPSSVRAPDVSLKS